MKIPWSQCLEVKFARSELAAVHVSVCPWAPLCRGSSDHGAPDPPLST